MGDPQADRSPRRDLNAVEIGPFDTELGQRDLDLRPMFDTMLDGVEQEEVRGIAKDLTLPGKIHVRIAVHRVGDLDELIARAHADASQHIEPRPRSVAPE